MRITDRVAIVASGSMAFSMTHPSDCNVYLVECSNSCILIDAGVGLASKEIIEEIIKTSDKPISHILITHHHADHIGGLKEISEYFNSIVVVPVDEAQSIMYGDEKVTGLKVARAAGYYPANYHLSKSRVDMKVSSGDVLRIEGETIKVFSAAGHSLGGVCYWFEDERILFVGDLVLHGGRINLQNIPGSNLEKYSQSVLNLSKLDVKEFYAGHGCFSINDGKVQIEKAAAAFLSLGLPENFL